MKNLLRPSRKLATLLLAWPGLALALNHGDWKFRQSVDVATPGLVRLALPPETLDAAQPGAADLRLLDASGQELSYLREQPAPLLRELRRPKNFSATLTGTATQLTIETGTTAALQSLELDTLHPHFLKAARVEVSPDGANWTTLGAGLPLFRQWGAEALRVPLDGKPAAFVRVTLDDFRSEPVVFERAWVRLADPTEPALVPLNSRIVRREEFAGESILTLALDSRRVPLARLEFSTAEPLFLRRVSVAVREVRNGIAGERTLATGTVYRLAVEGAPAREQLSLAVDLAPDTRELLVHIHNADSPPLALSDVRVLRQPTWLIFSAPVAGRFTLLSGNTAVRAPRYDLAAFARELQRAGANSVTPGALEPNPGYRTPEALAEIPLTGSALDVTAWRAHKPLQFATGGVQELELDLDVLARCRADFADLRLLRAGLQVPYLLERPALSRLLNLTLTPEPDPKRPTVSRWKLSLPRAHLPLRGLQLTSPTPLFERNLRVFEKIKTERGDIYESTLSQVRLVRVPGANPPRSFAIDLSAAPQTDTLYLETDNGDNPAIALAGAQAVYPVARLVFKAAATDSVVLYYDYAGAVPPSYDLALVADQLLASERNVAALIGELGAASTGAGNPFIGLRSGVLFWGALALVVVVLLVVVAKLLPKPPAA